MKRYMKDEKSDHLLFKVKPWQDGITGIDPGTVKRIRNSPLNINFVFEPQYRTVLDFSK
ncbi:MAG: hypothetical protein WDO19_12210 [Bacteroidota bacterium]